MRNKEILTAETQRKHRRKLKSFRLVYLDYSMVNSNDNRTFVNLLNLVSIKITQTCHPELVSGSE